MEDEVDDDILMEDCVKQVLNVVNVMKNSGELVFGDNHREQFAALLYVFDTYEYVYKHPSFVFMNGRVIEIRNVFNDEGTISVFCNDDDIDNIELTYSIVLVDDKYHRGKMTLIWPPSRPQMYKTLYYLLADELAEVCLIDVILDYVF